MTDQQERLFKEYREGALSERERDKLLSLFHHDDLEFDLKNELYDQLIKMENDSSPEISVPDFNIIWKKIEGRKISKKVNLSRRISVWSYAAAILIIGLLIGNILLQTRNENQSEFYSAVAPNGSVSEVVLPDSTLIFLNSGSKVNYSCSMNQKVREVYLTGEAWFKVKKSKEVPFLVHTSYYTVRVMGTEFNVKAYDDDQNVVTTLEKGEILVQSSGNVKLSKDVKLKPGEQLTYNKVEKSLKVHQVKTQIFSSWKDNKLIFVNTTLRELAVLLERKYGVDIQINNDQIAEYHYDGTIKNETILEVLDILSKTLPITYVVDEQRVVISKK